MTKKKGPTPRLPPHVKLALIPQPNPNTRTVFVYEGKGTVVMQGPGKLVMDCGGCGVPLLQGVRIEQVQNVVFRCPACGAYNETLD